MKKAAADIPDAWDDDWEAQVDSLPQQDVQPEGTSAPLTKAERLEQHAEANRKLWESADTPQTFHYLEANNDVPLASTFKPQVKVLSRKPVVAKDPVTGLARLALDDDADQSDKREAQLTPEQIRAKQKRDREEKQRRYDEARAKIFGESASSSRGSSPGTVTPPRPEGRHQSGNGRGRGRGGGPRNGPDTRQSQPDIRRQNSQAGPTRELYDPNYASKPELPAQRRGPEGDAWKSPPPRDEPQQPIRAPRGPDGSGRGGAGFVRRGGKES
ncbi:hypothetical protein HRG_005931 [Hirsutella rhossiliensis]|uniref:SUZ domain-containing protein n=1 Tax=Hirsutella rhossiliensis TaxID=111463 RepID=A0A9P8SI21_9HYPO|nr:uncharacterized protein HRG_05931 [Hirsutella rhossiliensis]KAH0963421.1 hypothetical protein HRG_05931 [Hirsutella rhossiliensis]